MNVLVTGCAGFIGSHLTELLLRDGHDVAGVDCFTDNYAEAIKRANLQSLQEWQNFHFSSKDLCRENLADLVDGVELVFHLAAEPGVRPSWGERFAGYISNNVLALQRLLEAVRAFSNARVVYASSSSIYGNAERMPTSETTVPSPMSPYGVTKLSGEHLCKLYYANFGLETAMLRYFTVYGPRQRPDMAFNIFCRNALTGSPVHIFGDGRQTRDFTYVSDAAEATYATGLLANMAGDVFNIGGGSQISLLQALECLELISSRSLRIEYQAAKAGDVQDTSADTTLARERLGYRPSVSLEQGLAAEFDWLRKTIE